MLTAEQSVATAAACPSCGDARPLLLGMLASQSTEFGFSDGGNLHECLGCHLLFLHKPGAVPESAERYGELPSDLLDELPRRKDFDLALAEMQRVPGPLRVLDVGCFRGDFLASLPERFKKFGIEPSHAARRVAEARGIEVLGVALETADVGERRFDVILMMDVAEHLTNPFAALSTLARWLAPGGRLIASTGNSDSLLWRLNRLNYWYYLPQHVSFCNPRWFGWAARRLQLNLGGLHKFSHSRRAYGKMFVAERWRQLVRSLAARALSACGNDSLRRKARGDATWPDHLLVVLQAPKSSPGLQP